MPLTTTTERDHLLQICRSVMPGVAGVVLATLQGGVVAHEQSRVADPHTVASHAIAHRDPAAHTSTLVNHAGDLYLVVFVPPALVDQLASCEAPALTA